jgi:hypothetical protein
MNLRILYKQFIVGSKNLKIVIIGLILIGLIYLGIYFNNKFNYYLNKIIILNKKINNIYI